MHRGRRPQIVLWYAGCFEVRPVELWSELERLQPLIRGARTRRRVVTPTAPLDSLQIHSSPRTAGGRRWRLLSSVARSRRGEGARPPPLRVSRRSRTRCLLTRPGALDRVQLDPVLLDQRTQMAARDLEGFRCLRGVPSVQLEGAEHELPLRDASRFAQARKRVRGKRDGRSRSLV